MQPVALQAAVEVGVGVQGVLPRREAAPWEDLAEQMFSVGIEELRRADPLALDDFRHTQQILTGGDFGPEPTSRIRVVDESEPNDEADLLRMLHGYPEAAS